MIALFVAWSLVSWQWYTCQIKGFCVSSAQLQDIELPEASVVNLTAPVAGEGIEIVAKEVTPVEVAPQKCVARLTQHIKLGATNDEMEVRKLEEFLNDFENEKLLVDGVYGVEDEVAVKRFQEKYREAVLTPWGLDAPTGFVYQTTREQINKMYCENQSK